LNDIAYNRMLIRPRVFGDATRGPMPTRLNENITVWRYDKRIKKRPVVLGRYRVESVIENSRVCISGFVRRYYYWAIRR
jgi:hypothetical protein